MDRVWFAKLRSERVIRTRSERARMERAQIAPKSATSQIRQGLAHHLVGGAGLDRAFGVPAMAKYLRGMSNWAFSKRQRACCRRGGQARSAPYTANYQAGYAQVLRRGENASGRSHSQPGECDGVQAGCGGTCPSWPRVTRSDCRWRALCRRSGMGRGRATCPVPKLFVRKGNCSASRDQACATTTGLPGRAGPSPWLAAASGDRRSGTAGS